MRERLRRAGPSARSATRRTAHARPVILDSQLMPVQYPVNHGVRVSRPPQDREERLVELCFSRAPVARVDRVVVRRIPACLGRDHVADDRAALRVCALVRGAAVERPAVVECGAARRNFDRNELELGPGRHRLARMREPVLGRVERAALRCVRPAMRAAHVVDRAGVCGGVVQRHPAGRHVRRIEVIEVGGVLMAQQRAARRRLPDRVVLRDAHPGLRRQPGGELADALREDRRGKHPVGLPDVAQLTGQLRRRAPRRVVDLVGPQAGLPVVLEHAGEAFTHAVELCLRRGSARSRGSRRAGRPRSARCSVPSVACAPVPVATRWRPRRRARAVRASHRLICS